jgi:hypothetical protein
MQPFNCLSSADYLCCKIVDRGAPATAIHVRDIVKQIYGFARATAVTPCTKSKTLSGGRPSSTNTVSTILPGCAIDCRNLIAFPDEANFDRIDKVAAAIKPVGPYTPATSGPALIEVTRDNFQ